VGQSDFLEGLNLTSFLSSLRGARDCSTLTRIREKSMLVFCVQKKDSNVPVCHVHNVPLKQQQIPIDANAPSLGRITCLLCPVSHSVVRETRRMNARSAY
jgi:hypothetical protein